MRGHIPVSVLPHTHPGDKEAKERGCSDTLVTVGWKGEDMGVTIISDLFPVISRDITAAPTMLSLCCGYYTDV